MAIAANSSEAAFRALLRTMGLIKRVMEPYLARHGLSGGQWGALRVLLRAEEEEGLSALRLVDLGRRLLIRPPSVTGVVGRLQRMSLVELTSSPTDHRAKDVRLTAAGRALVRRARRGHGERVEALMGGLASAEQADLCRLLDQLASHVARASPSGARWARPGLSSGFRVRDARGTQGPEALATPTAGRDRRTTGR